MTASVVQLAAHQSKESVAILEHLLSEARAGKIVGLAMAVAPVSGPTDIVFTDLFRRNPSRAAACALRMSIRLNELQDEIDYRQQA